MEQTLKKDVHQKKFLVCFQQLCSAISYYPQASFSLCLSLSINSCDELPFPSPITGNHGGLMKPVWRRKCFLRTQRAFYSGWCPSQDWKADQYVSIFCQGYDERGKGRGVGLLMILLGWGCQALTVCVTSPQPCCYALLFVFHCCNVVIVFLGTNPPSCVEQWRVTCESDWEYNIMYSDLGVLGYTQFVAIDWHDICFIVRHPLNVWSHFCNIELISISLNIVVLYFYMPII